MKMMITHKNLGNLAALCGVAFLAVLLVGCQTSGKLVSTEKSVVCPMCQTETRTAAVKGLTYTKHVCPGCKTITETDHYTGNVTSSVHVCDHCKAAVVKCPLCASK